MPINYGSTQQLEQLRNFPFFKSFTPYQVPQNQVLTENVLDMISVNYVPAQPKTNIEYNIATTSLYQIALQIKNLTVNSTLEITAIANNTSFLINSVDRYVFQLPAAQQRTITVQLNNSKLNAAAAINQIINSNIILSVKNLSTNVLVLKNSTAQPLQQASLPSTITII